MYFRSIFKQLIVVQRFIFMCSQNFQLHEDKFTHKYTIVYTESYLQVLHIWGGFELYSVNKAIVTSLQKKFIVYLETQSTRYL